MDALPLTEVPGRDYGSQNAGRMHACGHDGHMAMLLGAATILVERRAKLDRDVLFCFQPGEEGYGGGERMIREGVLDLTPIGSVFALHLWSPFAAGTVHVRPGPMMAAQDGFTARILGKGGHAAMPHAAEDTIVAAASAVTALQTIVSRNVDPLDPAVVSVGSLHAGTAGNILPDEAVLSGTLRSFSADVRELLRVRTREVIERAAGVHGCRLEFVLASGYPATINDAQEVERVRRAALPVFGAENVIEPRPMAPAEDFSYFLNERPGAFILVGAGNAARGITAAHHSPGFDIDESVLPRGAELLAGIALQQD
jgi:amidohydrolase